MSEENELLRELQRAFALFDPPPARLYEAARAAFDFRDPDAALAELTEESSLAAAGLRGSPRLLTFTGDEVTVELHVSAAGHSRTLAGRLSPAGATEVCIRHSGGETHARVDATGHFAAAGIPGGQMMLRFTRADAGSVVTSWTRL